MGDLVGNVFEKFDLDSMLAWKITLSVVSVIFILMVRAMVLRLVRARTDEVRIRYQWRKVSSYVAFSFIALSLLSVWTSDFDMSTFLALVSAGAVIVFKDPLVNFAGWIYIFSRRPFAAGDRVEIGEQAGDVLDVTMLDFTLLEIGNWVDADQSTGRVVHVPNGFVFQKPIANYNRGLDFLWNEIPVLVTFESNWRKAKKILQEVAEEHSGPLSEEAMRKVRAAAERYMISYKNLTPIVYTDVKESGVMLTIRHLVSPRHRRGEAQQIWESILDRFGAEADIDFAYPTQRLFRNDQEGKVQGRVTSAPGD